MKLTLHVQYVVIVLRIKVKNIFSIVPVYVFYIKCLPPQCILPFAITMFWAVFE
jgi:hypothetical protein